MSRKGTCSIPMLGLCATGVKATRQRRKANRVMMAYLPCFGAEIAVLRNGFSIRCQRRETIGPVTRLYPSDAAINFIDVPSDQIDRFEQEVSFSPVQATAPSPVQSVNAVSNSLSQPRHLDPNPENSVLPCSGRRLANDPPECRRSWPHQRGGGAVPVQC